MAKAKNLRRIPMDTAFIGDKKTLDILYGKFQIESNFNGKGEARMMEKVKLNKSEWAKELDISRPTLDTKIKHLKKAKLIVDKGENFEVPEFGKACFLMPEDTLRFLVDTANPNVIKVYAQLGTLWNFHGSSATFTENSLLTLIGYSTTKPANHKLVRNILISLANNGLIKYSEHYVKASGTTVKSYKLDVFNLTYRKKQM